MEQVGRWRLAHDLRRYSEEIRLLVPQMPLQAREEAQQWLEWVEVYLREQLEPAVAAPALPPDPQRRDSSIAPLIAGRSGNQAWMDWVAAGADVSGQPSSGSPPLPSKTTKVSPGSMTQAGHAS